MNRCEAPFQQSGTAVSALIGSGVESSPNESPLQAIRFAVVVCSNQRTPGAKRAIESVLSTFPKPGLVVIVDQAADATPDLLQVFDGLPGVIRIRDKGKGLSRARNIGTTAAEEAGATVAAYTDDDCTVEVDWLAGFASAFGMVDDVALVFGTTKAAPHDAEEGTIPAYLVRKKAIHRGVASKPLIEGMGACMAVRIDAWRMVGCFDERLGAGTPLAAAEENDLSMRLLRAGFAVAETPGAEVLHHGFRNRLDASTLMAGYMRGSGAATAKMLRLGGFAAVRALATIGKRWLSGGAGVEMGHLPSRRNRLANFLNGAITGSKLAIDPTTGRFLPLNGSDDLVPTEFRRHDGAAPHPKPAGIVQAIARDIACRRMAWLFNRRLTDWMRDDVLRCQLPPAYRWFAAYCLWWTTTMRWSWIPGGKHTFFVAALLNRLQNGQQEIFLRIQDAVVGLDLTDPRFIKVVQEILPGSGTTAILCKLLSKGDSFVDIGANHGAYSLAAARIVGPSGKIIAVEAQPRLARLLEKSLARSVNCPYKVHPVALGDLNGEVPFYFLRRNSGQSGLFRGPSTSGTHSIKKVPIERLDDAIEWSDLPGQVVVKIDVEGAEDRVLAGAVGFFTVRQPVLLMEVNPRCMGAAGVTWDKLLATLRSLGYDRYAEAVNPCNPFILETLDPSLQRDIIVWPAKQDVASRISADGSSNH